ncbi:MAG: hypothetical protein FWG70_11525 [Oscillospiraceae bacterium]|nr:hypothetical protein [Oscillospiraceae bacterium]
MSQKQKRLKTIDSFAERHVYLLIPCLIAFLLTVMYYSASKKLSERFAEQENFTFARFPLWKRAVSGAVAAALFLSFVPLAAPLASADTSVSYIDADGVVRECKEYTIVTEDSETLSNGWYVVRGDITRGKIEVTGTVHLILEDDSDLNVTGGLGQGGLGQAGIQVNAGANLTIYAQSIGDNMGKLTAQGSGVSAGIGGYDKDSSGAIITINGGNITATGGEYGAGIGGSYSSFFGAITINGGNITATAGYDLSCAIGQANGGNPVTVNISGFYNYWTSDTTTPPEEMSGRGEFTWSYYYSYIKLVTIPPPVSYIDADGEEKECEEYTIVTEDSATLSDGWYVVRGDIIHAAIITVTGDVHLILEDNSDWTVVGGSGDAGIQVSSGENLTIYAQSTGDSMGKLTVYGGRDSAGIGANSYGTFGTITINGGTITATSSSGRGAGIGIGYGYGGPGGAITINGGNITATASGSVSAIGGSNVDVNINGYYNYWTNEDPLPPVEMSGRGKFTRSADYRYISLVSIPPPVIYLDADGAEQECYDYTVVTADDATLSDGWYVVRGDITRTAEIIVTGDVHLILEDESHLSVAGGDSQAGIEISESGNLTIYAQSTSDDMGMLTARGGRQGAGIGGSSDKPSGSITINGGIINASNENFGAGIGGGYGGSNDTITINGGIITATGGNQGAGIGGSRSSSGGTITINGGTINATGGNYGAGIGSGYSGGSNDTITINGGNITATGFYGGAGIGSGYLSSCEAVVILGYYSYWVNTQSSQPTEMTGRGEFTWSASYSYIKLEEICKYEHTPGAEATCLAAQTCTLCGIEIGSQLDCLYEPATTCTADGTSCDRGCEQNAPALECLYEVATTCTAQGTSCTLGCGKTAPALECLYKVATTCVTKGTPCNRGCGQTSASPLTCLFVAATTCAAEGTPCNRGCGQSLSPALSHTPKADKCTECSACKTTGIVRTCSNSNPCTYHTPDGNGGSGGSGGSGGGGGSGGSGGGATPADPTNSEPTTTDDPNNNESATDDPNNSESTTTDDPTNNESTTSESEVPEPDETSSSDNYIAEPIVIEALEMIHPVIDLSETDKTVISSDMLQAIADSGKDVEVVLDSGFTFTILSDSISPDAQEFNLNIEIYLTERATEIDSVKIPANSIVINPNFRGSFGFEVTISFSAERLKQKGVNGNNVKLFHVDHEGRITDLGKLRLNADGSIEITISHASYYIIAENPPEGIEGYTIPVANTADDRPADTEGNPYTSTVAVSGFIPAILAGAGSTAAISRKKSRGR